MRSLGLRSAWRKTDMVGYPKEMLEDSVYSTIDFIEARID